MKRIFVWLSLILFLPLSVQAELEVHFLDVGQGDSTVVLCDGEAMVIDGGVPQMSGMLYSYLRNTLGVSHVQYVIATHPDRDHVGGLTAVMNAAPVDVILTPVLEWDGNKAFSDLQKYAYYSGTPMNVPAEGESFPLGGATVTVLHCWPEAVDYNNEKGDRPFTNDSSIVVRIDYGHTSFMVTGDAEYTSEYMMLDSGMNLEADVLRVAHHGSRYSTTKQFLRAVDPEYAVISAGKDNRYGHPHPETLERLAEAGVKVLRTDRDGTIVMVSDGENIRVGSGKIADREEAKGVV